MTTASSSNIPIWLAADTAAHLVFLVDILLRFAAARKKRKFLASLPVLLEILSLAMVAAAVYQFWLVPEGEAVARPYTVSFVRVTRLYLLAPLLFPPNLSRIRRQLIKIILIVFAIIVTMAGAFFMAERISGGTYSGTCPASECINFFDSIFFIVVTISTVGYGDVTPDHVAGKIVALVAIGVAVVVVPVELAELSTLLSQNEQYKKNALSRTKRSNRKEHVLVLGDLSHDFVVSFMREVNLTRLSNRLKIVLMAPNDPSPELVEKLQEPIFSQIVTYLNGSALAAEDLDRALVSEASAAFVTSDIAASRLSAATDAKTVLRCLSLVKYCESLPVYCFLGDAGARNELMEGRVTALSIAEMRAGVLFESARAPGFSSLLMHLTTSEIPTAASEARSEPWSRDYLTGFASQLKSVELPDEVEGDKFGEAAAWLLVHRSQILLAVVHGLDDCRQQVVLLAPMQYRVSRGQRAFVIQSATEHHLADPADTTFRLHDLDAYLATPEAMPLLPLQPWHEIVTNDDGDPAAVTFSGTRKGSAMAQASAIEAATKAFQGADPSNVVSPLKTTGPTSDTQRACEELSAKYMRIFEEFDYEKTGRISASVFHKILKRHLGMSRLSSKQARALFDLIDTDLSGHISSTEFTSFMLAVSACKSPSSGILNTRKLANLLMAQHTADATSSYRVDDATMVLLHELTSVIEATETHRSVIGDEIVRMERVSAFDLERHMVIVVSEASMERALQHLRPPGITLTDTPPPLVFLCPARPMRKFWTKSSQLRNLHIIVGSPIDPDDLRRCNIGAAIMVVLASVDWPSVDEGEDRTLTVDWQPVIAALSIVKSADRPQVCITELRRGDNVKFLENVVQPPKAKGKRFGIGQRRSKVMTTSSGDSLAASASARDAPILLTDPATSSVESSSGLASQPREECLDDADDAISYGDVPRSSADVHVPGWMFSLPFAMGTVWTPLLLDSWLAIAYFEPQVLRLLERLVSQKTRVFASPDADASAASALCSKLDVSRQLHSVAEGQLGQVRIPRAFFRQYPTGTRRTFGNLSLWLSANYDALVLGLYRRTALHSSRGTHEARERFTYTAPPPRARVLESDLVYVLHHGPDAVARAGGLGNSSLLSPRTAHGGGGSPVDGSPPGLLSGHRRRERSRRRGV
jgi:hypothetical protein